MRPQCADPALDPLPNVCGCVKFIARFGSFTAVGRADTTHHTTTHPLAHAIYPHDQRVSCLQLFSRDAQLMSGLPLAKRTHDNAVNERETIQVVCSAESGGRVQWMCEWMCAAYAMCVRRGAA